MGNFSKYCLLVTATGILLLHSFVPHQHHTIVSSEPSISACVHTENSLLGFLSQVFHLDLGNEHLENFKPVHKVDFVLSVPVVADIFTYELLPSKSINDGDPHPPAFAFYFDQFLTHQTPLRGPPHCKSIIPNT